VQNHVVPVRDGSDDSVDRRATTESLRPMRRTGTATTAPAIGPAAPMSISAFRFGTGDLILMNAPNVPMNDGAGMKNGGVTSMSCRLAAV
jgi:hypothetical protein